MIEARKNDGRFGAPGFPLPVVPGPGQWRPVLPAFVNDPNAWLRNVKPFMLESASQFRDEGAVVADEPAVPRDFNEVKEIGLDRRARRGRKHQTDAALYWAVHPGRDVEPNRPDAWTRGRDSDRRGRPPVRRSSTSRQPTRQISVWDDKAYWSFWRPITAIREADTDGNPRDGARPELGAADRDSAVPRAPVGPPRAERQLRRDASGVLQHGPDRLDGQRPPGWQDAYLVLAPLGCARRDHRRACLVRGSTSAPRTSSPPISRKRSRSGGSITTSRRLTDELTAGPRGETSRGPPPSCDRNATSQTSSVGADASNPRSRPRAASPPGSACPIHCSTAWYAERICGKATSALVILTYASRCAGSRRASPPTRGLATGMQTSTGPSLSSLTSPWRSRTSAGGDPAVRAGCQQSAPQPRIQSASPPRGRGAARSSTTCSGMSRSRTSYMS